MGYHYDPILCMNVPDSTSKAKDASWKAWTLYIDGKWVKSFSSSMAPIKEAQKFMKENYPGKVGKLVRNTGSSSGYSISGSEYKDAAPAGVRDADIKLVQTIASKNGYAVHVVESDYGKRVALTFKGESYKNPHMWLGEATEGNKRKAIEMMNEFAKNAGSKNHDSLNKAIRMCDEDVIIVKRRNKYWVDVNLAKSNPYISAEISKALKRDKRVESLLGSRMSWEVLVEGDDNENYVKKLLSGYGTIR